MLISQGKLWLSLFVLLLHNFERFRVGLLKTRVSRHRKFLVGLAQLVWSMCVGAVFGELASAGLLKKLAHLGLVIVVGNVEHLVLHLQRQSLVTPPHLMIPVSEMTPLPLNACAVLHKVLAESRLVEDIELVVGPC